MKSYVVTWNEYYQEFRDFNLEKFKLFFTEKSLKQNYAKETLDKK